ncbi:type VI secretion system baseplate subunit TssK [Simiduia curdlanivorans]|uniref:Type VI secretion system baseplate subunit TssK n=1 Tax=Simiduia curdlanivorans TaxID=1492769 RepID=A0ABV8V6F5_9GAMM|nr:type VI secretion system baseplate subunit TssK [Simiduia curdlanivorans]MDN3640217.1 type VI secretion system baseplate subunit TssK [Simiduia curdlanivorans]
MSAMNKVVWSEGMFLRPQHFQQQDRYWERYIDGRLGGSSAYSWGIQSLAIDSEPLDLGKISITEVKAVFPDGTPYCAPDIELTPEILEIPENTQNQIIYLCVPLKRPGNQDSIRNEEDLPQARYQTFNYDIRNSTSQSSEPARIQIGKLRVCLKLGSDDLSGYAAIGIARVIERMADKPIKLDREFIPPMMLCKASSGIKAYLEEVIGLLKQRGDALGHRLADSGRAGSAEIADYLLLQVINRVQPLLQQYAHQDQLHPFTLYSELIQLAGELATFTAASKRAPQLNAYQHDNLRNTYADLFNALRQSLSTVLEQSAVSLSLVERKYGIHVAPITDHSMVSSSTFVLAVKADVQTELLRSRFPSQAKLAPVETIRELITTQLPGIQIRALPVAPRQIPYHAGFIYFELDRSSAQWKHMQQSGGFAVHLGANFPGLIMELWAIRNQ